VHKRVNSVRGFQTQAPVTITVAPSHHSTLPYPIRCQILATLSTGLEAHVRNLLERKNLCTGGSNVTKFCSKLVELALGVGVFLGHLFVLGFPLVAGLLESLYFAFVVVRLDVGVAEPE
jgi:hypothetical protein